MAVGVKTTQFKSSPRGGLNLTVPADELPDEYCAEAVNVVMKQGLFGSRWGYDNLCSSLPASCRVTHIYHYESPSPGKTLEFFNQSAGRAWYMSGVRVNSCGLSGITLASCNAPLSAGDTFVTTCEYLDLSAVQPSLVACWSTYEHNPGSRMAPLLYQTSAKGKFIPILTSANDFTGVANTKIYAKLVRNYANYLVILCTYEGGNNHYQRVRWSDLARFGKDDWDDSNYNDLVDTAGSIVNAGVLNNTLIIYKEDAIIGMTHIGGSAIFRFDLYLPDEGLMSPLLFCPVGNCHYFVSNQGIYQYYGGQNIVNIGKPIWDNFLSVLSDSGADSHKPYRNRAIMVHYRDERSIAIFVPSGSTYWPKKAYVYNYDSKIWTIWNTEDEVTAFGEFEHDTGNGVVYLPVTGTAGGAIYSWSPTDKNDDGVAISAYWVTKEFIGKGGPDNYTLWDQLVFEAEAASATDDVTIYYRVDRSAWVEAATVTLTGGTTLTRYQANFVVAGRRAQFKFYSNTMDSRFRIGSYGIREMSGGPQ